MIVYESIPLLYSKSVIEFVDHLHMFTYAISLEKESNEACRLKYGWRWRIKEERIGNTRTRTRGGSKWSVKTKESAGWTRRSKRSEQERQEET